MKESLEIVDVSDAPKEDFIDISEPKKDIFMRVIFILLIILVICGLLVYFFGYDLLKQYIKV